MHTIDRLPIFSVQVPNSAFHLETPSPHATSEKDHHQLHSKPRFPSEDSISAPHNPLPRSLQHALRASPCPEPVHPLFDASQDHLQQQQQWEESEDQDTDTATNSQALLKRTCRIGNPNLLTTREENPMDYRNLAQPELKQQQLGELLEVPPPPFIAAPQHEIPPSEDLESPALGRGHRKRRSTSRYIDEIPQNIRRRRSWPFPSSASPTPTGPRETNLKSVPARLTALSTAHNQHQQRHSACLDYSEELGCYLDRSGALMSDASGLVHHLDGDGDGDSSNLKEAAEILMELGGFWNNDTTKSTINRIESSVLDINGSADPSTVLEEPSMREQTMAHEMIFSEPPMEPFSLVGPVSHQPTTLSSGIIAHTGEIKAEFKAWVRHAERPKRAATPSVPVPAGGSDAVPQVEVKKAGRGSRTGMSHNIIREEYLRVPSHPFLLISPLNIAVRVPPVVGSFCQEQW